jgi:hypothetical protein
MLCYDDKHGRIVANSITPDLFEGDFRIIAERASDYWKKYNIPPGDHIADLLSDIIDDPKNKRANTYKRILLGMRELSESINTKYVMDQLNAFTRTQKLKDAILKSAEKLNQNQETAIAEVESIWNDLLRVRETNYDPGMRLTDISRMLEYFRTIEDEFVTGIEEFNKRKITPARGKVMLMLAPPGKGKTWNLIDIARRNLMLRKKIVYISLEMSEEELVGRVYQNLFSVPTKENSDVNIRTFSRDGLNHLDGFGSEKVTPDFGLNSDMVRDELETRMLAYSGRYENLIVKRFPPRSISIDDIEAYLDNLETVEHFIPDMIILDYIGRIKTSLKEHRLHLGTEFENFRGLCIKRNMAGVTAHQIGRKGSKANQVRGEHIAEDFSLMNTADIVFTYSASEAEFALGLARLYVEKVRFEQDRFTVLITQNYTLGQFCLDSVMLTKRYEDLLKQETKDAEETENIEDNNDDSD